MSIVNKAGERIRPEPPPDRPATWRKTADGPSEPICLRNRRWLAIKRTFRYSNQDLADTVNHSLRTVQLALAWALAEEARDTADLDAVEAAEDRVVHQATGLTLAEVDALEDDYLDETDPVHREAIRGFFTELRAGRVPAAAGVA